MYYQDLLVWKKAMRLVMDVYRLVRNFPKDEKYALGDQMRRAVVSIPSNIAEGQQRQTVKEFIHFLYIAKGSCAELTTQLFICRELFQLDNEQIQKALAQTNEVGRMLTALIKNLSTTPHSFPK